jgi:hypothetical protein
MWHIAAAGAFAALALVWTFPLTEHLSTHLPGARTGDNVAFLWNFWWMRMALSSDSNYFYTNFLFVPTGADLTLHTHTALTAFVGSTVLSRLSVVTAQNLTILISLFLNGFCAYLLGWRITRDCGGALIGGLVFGGSPYIAAHLNGHFNLTTAWTIPLFTIAVSDAIRGSRKWAVLSGLLLGLTAYVDYYYVVFEIALAVCIVALSARHWSITWRGPSAVSQRLARFVGIVIVADALLIIAIVSTGGLAATIGPIRSVRGIFNPLQAFWILLALFLWLRFRPRVDAWPRETWAPGPSVRSLAVMAAIFVLTAAPLIWNAVGLLLQDEYVTQRYLWRSAPKGVDVATLVLGNPFHPLWGRGVQQVYGMLGIDAIETSAWLGIVPVVLALRTVRYHLRPTVPGNSGLPSVASDSSRVVRQWLVIGLIFFVWALGPHLMAFGQNSGLILPQALLRYVPLLDNARIPGRAMVVAYLALAVLAALAAAEWRRRSRQGLLAVIAVAFGVIADYLPAPFPLVRMNYPAVYEKLRDRMEPGALCELPLGIRDGFGERGMFDDRVLFYQTIHQRPLVGGFLARVPRGVTTTYDNDPLLTALLRLSAHDAGEENRPLPNRQEASKKLREYGIRFIILDRSRASPKLIEYVERVLPLTLIAEEDARSLYLVSE